MRAVKEVPGEVVQVGGDLLCGICYRDLIGVQNTEDGARPSSRAGSRELWWAIADRTTVTS